LSQLFRLAAQPSERLQEFTDLDIRVMLLDDSEAGTQTVEDNCSTLSSKTSAAPQLGMRIDSMSRLGISPGSTTEPKQVPKRLSQSTAGET
tara:strand:+ start:4275 stop:4547 length:273 start_codon:yes stop_codon:yes gene_type:complete